MKLTVDITKCSGIGLCEITAAAVVVTIPLILLVLYFQRRIVEGLTAGAVKG